MHFKHYCNNTEWLNGAFYPWAKKHVTKYNYFLFLLNIRMRLLRVPLHSPLANLTLQRKSKATVRALLDEKSANENSVAWEKIQQEGMEENEIKPMR